MVGPRGYVQHKDITISSPNLIGQNISQSELCLNQRKQQVRRSLVPVFYGWTGTRDNGDN